MNSQTAIAQHVASMQGCQLCPLMVGPVVSGRALLSKVYMIGQAPGPHEGAAGKPFAWTAGKTLFRWFGSIGLEEEQFRSLAYMAAVCRCFPGKALNGTDRVPNGQEIANCSQWMAGEMSILKPSLVIPVGKLAIEQCLGKGQLIDYIGCKFEKKLFGFDCDVIPLPHPSGASTWFKKEPGITLLQQGLGQIKAHSAWQVLLRKAGAL